MSEETTAQGKREEQNTSAQTAANVLEGKPTTEATAGTPEAGDAVTPTANAKVAKVDMSIVWVREPAFANTDAANVLKEAKLRGAPLMKSLKAWYRATTKDAQGVSISSRMSSTLAETLLRTDWENKGKAEFAGVVSKISETHVYERNKINAHGDYIITMRAMKAENRDQMRQRELNSALAEVAELKRQLQKVQQDSKLKS